MDENEDPDRVTRRRPSEPEEEEDVLTDEPSIGLSPLEHPQVSISHADSLPSSSSSSLTVEPDHHPYTDASWWSRLTFAWPWPLLKLGLERPLTHDDLPPILPDDSSRANLEHLQSIYSPNTVQPPHHQQQQSNRPRQSLQRALLINFVTSETWMLQPLIVISFIAKVVQAVCLGFLINVLEEEKDDNDKKGHGYYWASGIVVSGLVIVLEFHTFAFASWRKGMQYKIACTAALLEKILTLSSTHAETTLASTGRILNLASNDVERFRFACIFGSWLLWAPLQALGIGLLGTLWLLGPAFGVGVAVLCLVFVPLQMYVSHHFAQSRSQIARYTDVRVQCVSQAIRGARVVKTLGGEPAWYHRISQLRRLEVQHLQTALRLRAANEAVFFATNIVVSLIVLVVHVCWFESRLTPGDVFVVFTLVNVMQLELVKHGSLALMAVSECRVSVQRLQDFFEFPQHPKSTLVRTDDDRVRKKEEGNGNSHNNDQNDPAGSSKDAFAGTGGVVGLSQPPPEVGEGTSSSSALSPNKNSWVMISLQNVSCRWDHVEPIVPPNHATNRSEKQPLESTIPLALENVSIDFSAGTLTCVIGAVGSGKSALLLLLAQELAVTAGRVVGGDSPRNAYPTVAYAAQDPWIMNGTLQDNILMGHEYEADWYRHVLESCCLPVDLAQLPRGDQTVVGDRGVQLSGGQRARVGLARALYHRAQLLIADDPLSAVDARVGRHLFQQALQNTARAGTCVVLATHQHQYIHHTRCVLVDNGRIQCIGSYHACVQASQGTLKEHEDATHTTTSSTVNDNTVPIPSTTEKENTSNKETDEQGDTAATSIECKNESTKEKAGMPNGSSLEDDGNAKQSKAEQEERSKQGLVQFETYMHYMKALGGIGMVIFLLILYTCTQGSVLVTTATMARWAERDAANQQDTDIVATVCAMSALVVFLSVFRAFFSLELTLKASQTLHDRMAMAVLRAKIEFFDTNPLGRILNRFSADIGIADDQLPQTLFDLFVISFIIFGAVLTALTTLPFALAVLPFLVWYFARVRKIFVTSTRELKRLEGVARSPIFAMLSEALSGIATLRANGYISFFRQKFRHAHDSHTRVFFAFLSASRWVGFRMDSIVFLFTSAVSFLAVLVHEEGWFDVDPAILGLALSMLIYLSGVFQWCIRQSAEAVNQMVSVERILEFGNLEPEAALYCNGDNELLAKNWPTAGKIEYEGVSVRYRATLPLALRQISFSVPAGARVGVVGRTGSGKSTIVQTLFRLLEAEEGRILIDSQDISKVGLHILRTKISVIPQVPTLFSGCTVRDNLDIFQQHTDDEIRAVLTSCHLTEAVSELPDGWNSIVLEGGSNFSVGQRQLLCLARALLCQNKILVLDEATASVDRRTDQLLQQALQESYRDGTILAVAHRLDTVIDYDFILVLGHGQVLEFGSPAELLMDDDGVFTRMVNDTGEVMSAALREKASTAPKKSW